MSDVNLGTVSTQIDIDTSTLSQRVNEVLRALDSIKAGASRASTGMSEAMVNGLADYQKRLEIISQKLVRQRELVEKLNHAQQSATGGNSDKAEKTAIQLEREKTHLMELEAQFDRTQHAQQNFVVEQDKAAKQAVETANAMDLRKAGDNMKAGTAIASSGLQTLGQVAPDLAGNIGNIITQINTTRDVMDSMASTPAKWATGITSAVGIVLTIVMAGINYMKEEEKKRQRVFEEGVKNIEEYSDKLSTLKDATDVFSNYSSSADEIKSKNQELANTFPELVIGHDKFGNAILANQSVIDEYIKSLKQMQKTERENVILTGSNKKNDYDKQVDSINRFEQALKRISIAGNDISKVFANQIISAAESNIMILKGETGFFDLGNSLAWKNMFGGIDTSLAEQRRNLQKTEVELQQYNEEVVKHNVKVRDSMGEMNGTWEDMNHTQELVAKNIYTSNIGNIKNGSITAEKVAVNIENTINNAGKLQEAYDKLLAKYPEIAKQESLSYILADGYREQQAPVSALSDAYVKLAEGGNLTDRQMRALAQTFPVINEYLEKTGDLTLDHGKIISEAMAEIDYSSQIDGLMSLSQAYENLASGQQLSISQLYELAQQYPEVAQYLAETGDATLNYGEVLKSLYETKRQGLIQEMDGNRISAISMKQAAESSIKSIEAQINALLVKMNVVRIAGMTDMDYLTQMINAESKVPRMPGMTDMDYQAANTSALHNLRGQLGFAQEEYRKQEEAVKKAEASLALLNGLYADINNVGGSSGKSNGGGSGSTSSPRNEALAAELKQLEQKKKMDQLTTQEELNWLERLQKKYALSADEKMDMEYRIYSVKKQLEQELEQAATERLQAEYKALENKKSLGELTSQEELAWLSRIQSTFRMNKDEQMELEIKLYNLKKQLHDEDVEDVNSLGAAVTEALKNKYKEQQEAEQQRIQDSIQSWKDWEDETVNAIQGQIDALDELEKQQDEEEKRAEYEKKRQATALQLAYEKDDYNRKQLQMELARIDAEERKRQEELDREKQREELQKELDKTKDTSSQQQDALQKELDELNKTYDELTKDFHLRAEAEKAIMESSQKEILALIQSYAPEYDLAGQTIGEKLAEGFKKKVGDIAAYMEKLTQQFVDYQDNLAATATAAADDFWKSREEYDRKLAAAGAPAPAKSVQINMEVQFNRQVESPIEIRRQMDRVAEDLARRIGG